jgi:hypothetical protein
MKVMLMRERDRRKVFFLHYVIFTLCNDYPDGAYLYTRILARFCCKCEVWEDED